MSMFFMFLKQYNHKYGKNTWKIKGFWMRIVAIVRIKSYYKLKTANKICTYNIDVNLSKNMYSYKSWQKTGCK